MLRRFFDTKPDERSATFAEAQALLDDGLDLDFVLGIFPDEADWLPEELDFTAALSEAYSSETPSYYFEGSLKSKFLAAARAPARQPSLPVAGSPYRAAIASMTVAAATLGLGVLTFGFVTAGSAVPGDWNYSFKLAHERLQYTLSRGDDRVNIQLRQTETRVEEIQRLSSDGHVSASDLERLNNDARALADIARSQPLDDVQKSRVQGVAATGATVLNDVKAKQPDLEAPVSAAAAALGDAAVTALATPTPSPTPTETPSPTPSASPSPTETGTPTGTAEPTTSATPTGVSGQSEPSATPTAAETTESATPSATPNP